MIYIGGDMMATQMIIRIEPKVKNRLNKLARSEGKTISQVVRELIEDYIKERDIAAYIDDLWNRIGEKLKAKRVRPSDIDGAIEAVRKNKDEGGY